MQLIVYCAAVFVVIPFVLLAIQSILRSSVGRILGRSIRGLYIQIRQSFTAGNRHREQRNYQNNQQRYRYNQNQYDHTNSNQAGYESNTYSRYSTNGNTRHHTRFLTNLVEIFQPNGKFEQEMTTNYKYLAKKFLDHYHPIILDADDGRYKKLYNLLRRRTHPDTGESGFTQDELNQCFAYINEFFPKN
ncbi:MAG: hypothetical protein RIC57_01440 [Balneola sp.]